MTNRKPPQNQNESPKTRLLHRAVGLLARRDHTKQELIDKLKRSRYEVDPLHIQEIIDRLESKGYLKPPEKVAEQLIPQYQRRQKGSRWIENKLKSKGIKLTVEQQKTLGLKNDVLELKTARELLQKKFKSLGPFKDKKEKARAIRALASRGYPMDVIMKAVKGPPIDEGFEEL